MIRSSTLFFRRGAGLLVILLMLIPTISFSAPVKLEDERNILILNSYNWGFGWTDRQMEGLLQGFQESGNDLILTIDQLDVIGRPSFESQTYAEYLKWRLGDKKFSIVVVTDNAALKFVADHYDELFKGVAVIFSDVSHLETFDLPPDMPVTGVREHTEFMSTIDLALKLRPKAQEIVVFGNALENGTGPRTAQTFVENLDLDIPVNILLDKPMEEILDIVSKVDPNDIIINLSYALDKDNKVHEYVEASEKIASVSPAPLFDFWSVTVRAGSMVGGMVSDPYSQGYAAAGLALRVLGGEKPEDIPALIAPTRYMFYYPQLVRNGIGLDELPEASEILERPQSVYEDYKDLIWGTVALLVFMSVVIIVLLYAIRIRRQSETALAAARDQLEEKVDQRTAELVATNGSLKNTLSTLELAQSQLVESEKMAALGGLVCGVAHEINTPVGISVTAASSLQDYTDRLVADYQKNELDQAQLEEFIDTAKQTSGILMTNLERAAGLVQSFKLVAVDQSTESAREIDLKSYLKSTVESLTPELKAGEHSIEVDCPDELLIETYPGIIAQILTNFVLNSVRHGFGKEKKSGQIHIGVIRKENGIELSYADDGKGMQDDVLKHAFDPFFTTARGQGGTGLGLSIVYNLVSHKLGGKIKCQSTPGEGVLFTLLIPDRRTNEERAIAG
jgi:signal transduction histidine kinase